MIKAHRYFGIFIVVRGDIIETVLSLKVSSHEAFIVNGKIEAYVISFINVK